MIRTITYALVAYVMALAASVAVLLAVALGLPARGQGITSPGLSLRPLGYCQLTSLAAATLLSSCSAGVPATANAVYLVVESQGVRIRDDGVAPTASVGLPVAAGSGLYYAGTLSGLQIIQQSASATVNAVFYRSP
jgi:hypothetical protein